MKRWPVLLLYLLAASAVMASDVSVLELAPPGTTAAVGLNVRGLLDSPMLKDLAADQKAKGLQAIPKIFGFDLTKDLDQVLVYMKSDGAKQSAFVVLSGRFDSANLGDSATRYRDVAILGSNDGVVAILDGTTAIFGERADVEGAIDRRGSGTQLGADLAARIDEARQKYDAWGVGDCPGGIPVPGEAGPMLRAIDRFSFGAALRQGLELNAEVHAKTAEDAAKLAAALGMIKGFLKDSAKDDGTKFDMHVDGETFQLSLSVPESAMKAQKAMIDAAFAPEMKGEGMPAAPVAAEAAPVVPAPPPTTSQPAMEVASATPPATQPVSEVAPPATPATQGLADAPPAVAPDAATPVLESVAPPLPAVAAPVMEPPPVPVKPAGPIKLPNNAQIVKGPNGDTLYLKLPGGK